MVDPTLSYFVGEPGMGSFSQCTLGKPILVFTQSPFYFFLPIKNVTCSNCFSHAYLAAMVSGRILRTRSWAPWALGTDDVKTESLLMLEKGLG